MKCPKHPRYRGRGNPPHCEACLKIHQVMSQKPRMPIRLTKLIKDKTKFRRKAKHPKKEL